MGINKVIMGEDGTPLKINPDGSINVTLSGDSGGGGTAMKFYSGAGAPDASLGNDGDVYLNSTNGDFYEKQSTWNIVANLKGPQGSQGQQGIQGPKGDKGDKGDTGPAGFGTEAQYNDIIERLNALEAKVNGTS